jgi:hypothetical protein
MYINISIEETRPNIFIAETSNYIKEDTNMHSAIRLTTFELSVRVAQTKAAAVSRIFGPRVARKKRRKKNILNARA